MGHSTHWISQEILIGKNTRQTQSPKARSYTAEHLSPACRIPWKHLAAL